MFICSFDDALFGFGWDVTVGFIARVTGRTGYGAQVTAGMGEYQGLYHFFPALLSGGYCGTAYKTDFYANFPLIMKGTHGEECGILHIGDGRVQVRGRLNNNNYMYSDVSDEVLRAGQWAYFELYVSAGAKLMGYAVWVNGKLVLSDTFVFPNDPIPPIVNSFNGFGLIGPGGGGSCIVDDVYFHEVARLGDIMNTALLPNLAGDKSEWTPLVGPANYEDVDEVTPDGDTTYVHSSTVGNVDLYNYQALGSGIASIHIVQASLYARSDDGGSQIALHVWKPGTTEHTLNAFSPDATYRYYKSALDRNPDTLAAWVESEVNALQHGVEYST